MREVPLWKEEPTDAKEGGKPLRKERKKGPEAVFRSGISFGQEAVFTLLRAVRWRIGNPVATLRYRRGQPPLCIVEFSVTSNRSSKKG